MPLFFLFSSNSFSDKFSILIRKNKEKNSLNMYLLLTLSYAKFNDVVTDKYGLKYIILAKCANILLDYLF